MVLEAKCPQCDKRAEVDEEMIEVNCKHCGFRVRYDEYVEIMKGRAVSMTDDFQMNWDRHPIYLQRISCIDLNKHVGT